MQGHTFRAVFMPGKIPGRFAERGKLSERQQKAVEYIRKHGQISRRDYAELTGISGETAKRDLGKLVHDGVLFIHRAGRSTVYTLIES